MTADPHYGAKAATIMEIAEDHWPHSGNVHFEDAGACPSSAPGAVRVKSAGDSPLSGHSGMGYNPEFYDKGQHYVAGFSGSELGFSTPKSASAQGNIIHELGHLLGFFHEMERADFTAESHLIQPGFPNSGQQCDSLETDGGTPASARTDYTSPDENSIMDRTYCNLKTVLSAQDKVGVAVAYGAAGSQRYNAFARDTNNDLRLQQWTSSGWTWSSSLSTTDTNNAGSVVTLRVGLKNQVWVFSTTPSGGLLAYWFDGSNWNAPANWTDKVLGADPAAVVYRDYGKAANGKFAESPFKLRVFSTDSSGLVSRYWNGSTWSWESFGNPSGTFAAQVGGAVSFRDWGLTEESFYVFVRGTDNKLYLRYGTTGSPTTWTGDLGAGGPNIGGAGGSPGTALSFLSNVSNQREIWYWTTANGLLWSYNWTGSTWVWTFHGNQNPNVLGKLAASTWTVDGVRWQSVFMVDSNGDLNERKWNGSAWSWVFHGKPSGVTGVQDPSAIVVRNPGTADDMSVTPVSIARYVFVRGSDPDKKLYVRYTGDGTSWAWADQTTPYGGPDLKNSYPIGTSSITYWSP